MVQAGILGNLRFNYTERHWVVDLGQALANYEHLSHPGQSLRYNSHDKAYIRSVITRHLTKHGLDHHRGELCLVDLEVGGELFPDHLMAETVERVSHRSRDDCAFLRIGFAARLLELVSISSDPDLREWYIQKARSSLNIIQFECRGVQLNDRGLYRLLAEPPLDETSIWGKLKRASQPLMILFIAADPRDAERLSDSQEAAVRLDPLGELAALQEAVNAAVVHESLTVRPFPGGRFSQLSDYLAREKPVVLHFSGHGTEHGFRFRNDMGGVAEIDPQAFAKLLAKYRERGLRGVVMNACYTAEQAQFLADATGHAIAMDGRLSDSGAIAFAQPFYRSLGAGETFDEAFELAVAATELDPNLIALNPKLFKGAPRSPTSPRSRPFFPSWPQHRWINAWGPPKSVWTREHRGGETSESQLLARTGVPLAIDPARKFVIYMTSVAFEKDSDSGVARAKLVLWLKVDCENIQNLVGFNVRLDIALDEGTDNRPSNNPSSNLSRCQSRPLPVVSIPFINPSQTQYAFMDPKLVSRVKAAKFDPILKRSDPPGAIDFECFSQIQVSSYADVEGKLVKFQTRSEPGCKVQIRFCNPGRAPVPSDYPVLIQIEKTLDRSFQSRNELATNDTSRARGESEARARDGRGESEPDNGDRDAYFRFQLSLRATPQFAFTSSDGSLWSPKATLRRNASGAVTTVSIEQASYPNLVEVYARQELGLVHALKHWIVIVDGVPTRYKNKLWALMKRVK